jgi:hypothetical protein
MEKEKKLIKIDVEGHELQGGPVSTKIAAGRSPQANIQVRIKIRAARI